MTKDDLMEHFDEVVTDRRLTRDVVEAHLAALSTDAYLLDEYHVCASGGSSGPCGTTLMRIDDIQGRLDDCFTYPGGQTVHPLTFRSPLGRERDIIEYQVCQTARGADVLVRCQGPIDTTRIAETIRAALVDLGLTGAEVSVTPVDALGRQSTGKLRRFVPLAGASAGS